MAAPRPAAPADGGGQSALDTGGGPVLGAGGRPPPRGGSAAEAVPQTAPRLWVAISFPALALQVLAVGERGRAVVTEASRRGELVHQASESARSKGIKRGMGVSAALALCAGLEVYRRDPGAERRLLRGLARWAGGFTPTVTTEPPGILLLEVAASLRLFGGIDALCRRLRLELDRAGLRFRLAAAPTPGAAAMLASAGRDVLITGTAGLRSSLQTLPTGALGLADATLRRLRAAGITHLEALWRLPRHDLARRFGPEVVRKLDQALGAHPDPRRVEDPPARFDRRCALEAETTDAVFILRAARPLLGEFSDFLVAGSGVAGDVLLFLEHAAAADTRIDLATRLPTCDAAQWAGLLEEHLRRLELPAPVAGLRLSGSIAWAGNDTGKDLFGALEAARGWETALDELEARLGGACLWAPKVTADHRPERAWERVPAATGVAAGVSCPSQRPLWLLRKPRRLTLPPSGRSSGAGSLVIVDGPERIEAGWWDDNEYCRDYYTALCPQGRRLWVFQDLRQGSGWYLHGLFG